MPISKVINIPFMSIEIQQQTEGGLINIQPILEMVNQGREFIGKEKKDIDKYFKSDYGQGYVTALLDDMEKLSNINRLHISRNSTELLKFSNINGLELSLEEHHGFSMADLKAFGIYKDTRKTKQKEAGVWLSPPLAENIIKWFKVGENRKAKKSYIYFILHEVTKEIKIGTTTDIKKRFNVLNTMNANHLKLVNLIEGDYKVERKIHTAFSKYRIQGTEWFTIPEGLLNLNNKNQLSKLITKIKL